MKFVRYFLKIADLTGGSRLFTCVTNSVFNSTTNTKSVMIFVSSFSSWPGQSRIRHCDSLPTSLV